MPRCLRFLSLKSAEPIYAATEDSLNTAEFAVALMKSAHIIHSSTWALGSGKSFLKKDNEQSS